jgi:hypothetical protein
MFKLHWWVNSIEQMTISGYFDRDDALRKANELWKMRDEICRVLGLATGGRVRFEIVDDTDVNWDHQQILAEIQTRPELLEPPKVY